MVTFRVGGALLVAIALVSIDTRTARSQGSGSATAGSDEGEDEDAAAGSAKALVAPKSPKERADWLRDKLTAAISSRPTLAKAKIAVAITDLATGNELYAHDADGGMNLASNAKLLTTVTALGTIGGGFRWRTTIYADDLDDATGIVKGNLYVRGRGDPTLAVADLRALAADVAARGVRTVQGQLIVDTSYFDGDIEPPHYSEQSQEHAGFRAPVGSFGVARSAVTLTVIAEPGGTAKVSLDPDAGDYVKVTKAEVTSAPEGRTRVKVETKPKKDHLELEVTGQIRPADGSYELRRRVDDPVRFAAEVFRKALAERGVKIAKRAVATAAIPPAAKLVAEHQSAPLALVIREMNKQSDNFIAETVLKTIGAESRTTPGPATWADGTSAVRAYLAKLGMTGSYRADNGSGLFGASEVSAHQIVALLRAAHADYRIGPDLVGSLPTGGVDGTLAKRWHGHPARGRVRAKTGTLDKVTTLSGFVGIDGNHLLAFAIFVNDIPAGHRAASRAMADDMIDIMVAYLEPQPR